MLCTAIYSDPKPEKYKDYRNRTKGKHIDKLNHQLWQIKDCSLKIEDKQQLKKELLSAIESFNF